MKTNFKHWKQLQVSFYAIPAFIFSFLGYFKHSLSLSLHSLTEFVE